jgi:hypothetical protein
MSPSLESRGVWETEEGMSGKLDVPLTWVCRWVGEGGRDEQ